MRVFKLRCSMGQKTKKRKTKEEPSDTNFVLVRAGALGIGAGLLGCPRALLGARLVLGGFWFLGFWVQGSGCRVGLGVQGLGLKGIAFLKHTLAVTDEETRTLLNSKAQEYLQYLGAISRQGVCSLRTTVIYVVSHLRLQMDHNCLLPKAFFIKPAGFGLSGLLSHAYMALNCNIWVLVTLYPGGYTGAIHKVHRLGTWVQDSRIVGWYMGEYMII